MVNVNQTGGVLVPVNKTLNAALNQVDAMCVGRNLTKIGRPKVMDVGIYGDLLLLC